MTIFDSPWYRREDPIEREMREGVQGVLWGMDSQQERECADSRWYERILHRENFSARRAIEVTCVPCVEGRHSECVRPCVCRLAE